MKETKIVGAVLTVLIAFVFLLGSSRGLWAGESSDRASANAAGLHLTTIHVKAPNDGWLVSGFAPGVGSFNQSILSTDANINYKDGSASVNTAVVTSLGLTIAINVTWTATSSQITQTVSIPNPARTLTVNLKRASVSGTVGTFTIAAGTSGAIGKRDVTP